MAARIYKPARNAMQQGMAARPWVLEYEPEEPLLIEPLMGWTSHPPTPSRKCGSLSPPRRRRWRLRCATALPFVWRSRKRRR